MGKQRDIPQTKGQDKAPETDLNEMEIPCSEFKITAIKMLTKVRRTIHEKS